MIKLITAKYSDKKFFYILRNDKKTRKNSFNKYKIDFQSHCKWFKKEILNKSHQLFKIFYKNKSCGYLRIEKKNKRKFISISIKEKLRKNNIGSQALQESELFLGEDKYIFANVVPGNSISINFFSKNGYKIIKKNDKIITMRKKIGGLKIINKIEKIRGKNNFNWMNILRLAYKKAPNETSKIMSKIYRDDLKISKLVKKLTN